MGALPPFFDSFYSNPETRVAKLSIATGVGGSSLLFHQTPLPGKRNVDILMRCACQLLIRLERTLLAIVFCVVTPISFASFETLVEELLYAVYISPLFCFAFRRSKMLGMTVVG